METRPVITRLVITRLDFVLQAQGGSGYAYFEVDLPPSTADKTPFLWNSGAGQSSEAMNWSIGSASRAERRLRHSDNRKIETK